MWMCDAYRLQTALALCPVSESTSAKTLLVPESFRLIKYLEPLPNGRKSLATHQKILRISTTNHHKASLSVEFAAYDEFWQNTDEDHACEHTQMTCNSQVLWKSTGTCRRNVIASHDRVCGLWLLGVVAWSPLQLPLHLSAVDSSLLLISDIFTRCWLFL